jgi:hypothetical protein
MRVGHDGPQRIAVVDGDGVGDVGGKTRPWSHFT